MRLLLAFAMLIVAPLTDRPSTASSAKSPAAPAPVAASVSSR